MSKQATNPQHPPPEQTHTPGSAGCRRHLQTLCRIGCLPGTYTDTTAAAAAQQNTDLMNQLRPADCCCGCCFWSCSPGVLVTHSHTCLSHHLSALLAAIKTHHTNQVAHSLVCDELEGAAKLFVVVGQPLQQRLLVLHLQLSTSLLVLGG